MTQMSQMSNIVVCSLLLVYLDVVFKTYKFNYKLFSDDHTDILVTELALLT